MSAYVFGSALLLVLPPCLLCWLLNLLGYRSFRDPAISTTGIVVYLAIMAGLFQLFGA